MVQPTQTDPQFKLRYPADLKARIEKAAKSNNRSINAEIVATLEEKYQSVNKEILLCMASYDTIYRYRDHGAISNDLANELILIIISYIQKHHSDQTSQDIIRILEGFDVTLADDIMGYEVFDWIEKLTGQDIRHNKRPIDELTGQLFK